MDYKGKCFVTKLYLCIYVLVFQEAQLARKIGNGFNFDKSHKLVVNIFDDFERYMKVPDESTAAETKPYTPGVSLFP